MIDDNLLQMNRKKRPTDAYIKVYIIYFISCEARTPNTNKSIISKPPE